METLARHPWWTFAALVALGVPGVVAPRGIAGDALTGARRARERRAEAEWMAGRRPLTESPLRSSSPWLASREGEVEHRVFDTVRVDVRGERVLAVAQDRTDRALLGAMRADGGWVFLAEDGTVAAGDTFTGRLRVLGRVGCAALLDADSRGRAVIVDVTGAFWTTDGRAELARMVVPSGALKVVFHDARYGLTIAEEGVLWETRNAGRTWTTVAGTHARAARALDEGVLVETGRGLLRFTPGGAPSPATAPPDAPPDNGVWDRFALASPLGRALEARFGEPVRVLETPQRTAACEGEPLRPITSERAYARSAYSCVVGRERRRPIQDLGDDTSEGAFHLVGSDGADGALLLQEGVLETGRVGVAWRGADLFGVFENALARDPARRPTEEEKRRQPAILRAALSREGVSVIAGAGVYWVSARGDVRPVAGLTLPTAGWVSPDVAVFGAYQTGGVFGALSWRQGIRYQTRIPQEAQTLWNSLAVATLVTFSLRPDGALEHARWQVHRGLNEVTGWVTWRGRSGPFTLVQSGESDPLVVRPWDVDARVTLPTMAAGPWPPCADVPAATDHATLYVNAGEGVGVDLDTAGQIVDFEGDPSPFADSRRATLEVSPRGTCVRAVLATGGASYFTGDHEATIVLQARRGSLVGAADTGRTQYSLRCRVVRERPEPAGEE